MGPLPREEFVPPLPRSEFVFPLFCAFFLEAFPLLAIAIHRPFKALFLLRVMPFTSLVVPPLSQRVAFPPSDPCSSEKEFLFFAFDPPPFFLSRPPSPPFFYRPLMSKLPLFFKSRLVPSWTFSNLEGFFPGAGFRFFPSRKAFFLSPSSPTLLCHRRRLSVFLFQCFDASIGPNDRLFYTVIPKPCFIFFPPPPSRSIQSNSICSSGSLPEGQDMMMLFFSWDLLCG